MWKINENSYKLELLGDLGFSRNLDVADLSEYLDDEENIDSRTSLLSNFRRMIVYREDMNNFYLNNKSTKRGGIHVLIW